MEKSDRESLFVEIMSLRIRGECRDRNAEHASRGCMMPWISELIRSWLNLSDSPQCVLCCGRRCRVIYKSGVDETGDGESSFEKF